MFTPDRRRRVRAELIERARHDDSIAGAAITGSAARDAEDRWSDIDLFLGVADRVAVGDALRAWSDVLYREFAAIHHFDLPAGAAVYRAFAPELPRGRPRIHARARVRPARARELPRRLRRRRGRAARGVAHGRRAPRRARLAPRPPRP